jgi:2-haloacid dehalogenase
MQSAMQSEPATGRTDCVLFDLLMGVMNSLELWTATAGDRGRGLQWRDAVSARMRAAGRYVPYEELVSAAAMELGLDATASAALIDRWPQMDPWPDAIAINSLGLPYGFVTNCSTRLADIAAARSGLEPRFALSAEEAGCYKPKPEIYCHAVRKLGFTAERTAFVAGSSYDAAGARDAGMRSWLVARRLDPGPADPGISVAQSLTEVVAQLAKSSS